MSTELYLGFLAATVALALMPGPNVALITANSVAYGRKFGLITVLGTTAAMVPQLALTVLGMTGLLALAGELFEWVRWIGVAYLVYLGFQAWRAPGIDLTQIKPEPRSVRSIFWRGFLVSSANPKTLLFYGAFFPQFVSPDAPIVPQLILLSVSFLTVALTFDSCWALLADRLRGLLASRGLVRNRLTGSFYFAAAVGLASVKRG
ncbi:LysE family translocator [Brucella endophytica]|uniref:LysE family translocator n=1 Tax=Brucella endophytica TaxID=1963359 RepID=UPI00166D8E90|nr:LysE family translocator [Brucella endophytica]